MLDELCIANLQDLRLLEEIAYVQGALVREKAMRGAEARLTMAGRRAIITLSSTVTDPQRKRFSIAHELGHLEMHRTVSSLSLCTKGDLDDWQSDQSVGNREQEADSFAAALLMPQRFFAQVCRDGDPSLDLVQGLAHQFDTSLTATALRYTEFCDEAIAVAFSQNGFVTWFRRSKEFEALGAFVEVKCRLVRDSHAFLIYQNGNGSRKAKRVHTSAWLTDGNYHEDASILEQSWALSSVNNILTMLWIDDDISDDDDYWTP